MNVIMKKFSILFATLLCCSGVFAQDRITAFIEHAQSYASLDLSDFHKHLCIEYNVRDGILDECYRRCDNNWGNVGLILEIAKTTGKSPKDICHYYEHNKKHGWGRILKEAGIAPNSNYYKKFYNRIDFQDRYWKNSHDVYKKKHSKHNKHKQGKGHKEWK